MIVVTTRTSYEPIEQNSLVMTCPLCHHETDIDMTFYRVITDTNGVHTKTKKVTASTVCHHCQEDIPVTKWTKPMQDTFETFKRETRLKREVTYSKRFWWAVVIGFGLPVIILAVVLVGSITSSRRAAAKEQMIATVLGNPQVNDKFIIVSIKDEQINNVLYNVTAVDDTTLTAVASEQIISEGAATFSDFEISDAVFTGKTVTISKEGLMKYENWTDVNDPDNTDGVFESVWDATR
jgi:hypothetical protein